MGIIASWGGWLRSPILAALVALCGIAGTEGDLTGQLVERSGSVVNVLGTVPASRSPLSLPGPPYSAAPAPRFDEFLILMQIQGRGRQRVSSNPSSMRCAPSCALSPPLPAILVTVLVWLPKLDLSLDGYKDFSRVAPRSLLRQDLC